jgi:hypothetical protein
MSAAVARRRVWMMLNHFVSLKSRRPAVTGRPVRTPNREWYGGFYAPRAARELLDPMLVLGVVRCHRAATSRVCTVILGNRCVQTEPEMKDLDRTEPN